MTTLRLHGLDLSYYTGKTECYLRVKGLPFDSVEMSTTSFRDCARRTGVAQMPQLEFPDGRWLTDSSQIIEYFEAQSTEPPIYPKDPALCFIAHLLEDFGDEWLWRPAMHYRWSFQPDARLASDRLARGLLRDVRLPLAVRRWFIDLRQRHLFVRKDGVTRRTAPLVETLYREVLDAMQAVLKAQPFLMGVRPTQADFGLVGSMYRHFSSDPTPAGIMRTHAPDVLAWVGRMQTLTPQSFASSPHATAIPDGLDRLMALVCERYLPYLACNEGAFEAGAQRVAWSDCGVAITTPTNPYRVWCLNQLRRRYAALSAPGRAQVDNWLATSSAHLGANASKLLAQAAGPAARTQVFPAGLQCGEGTPTPHSVNSQWRSS